MINWFNLSCNVSLRFLTLFGWMVPPLGNSLLALGIRQMDLLSPFLFILGMKILSRLFDQEERDGNLQGIKTSRLSPAVSHLMYADDLLVFSKGTSLEASCILKCLHKFSYWSGQKVDMDKSSIFLSSNCSDPLKENILSILRMRHILYC